VQNALPAVGQNLSDHAMVTLSYDLHNHPGMNREFSGWRIYWHAIRYFLGFQGMLARLADLLARHPLFSGLSGDAGPRRHADYHAVCPRW